MSVRDKINNAKPTTWLVDGMTQEEVKECIDNGKIKCAVVKALEEVKAEVEAMYGVTDFCDGSIRVDKYEVLVSIERKIKEYTHET